jgi:dihydropteroate synthase
MAATVRTPKRLLELFSIETSKPGIEHNLPLLVGLDMFKRSGYPVLIGASRKRFVSAALNDAGIGEPTMDDRDNATAALSALCAEHGAWAVRVHDVRRSRAALTIGSLWRQYQN